MSTDTSRIELLCSPEDADAMRRRAEAAGFPGRGFAEWARQTLLGMEPKVRRPDADDLISVAGAAEVAGVTRSTVYFWINQGHIRAFNLPEGKCASRSAVQQHAQSRSR